LSRFFLGVQEMSKKHKYWTLFRLEREIKVDCRQLEWIAWELMTDSGQIKNCKSAETMKNSIMIRGDLVELIKVFFDENQACTNLSEQQLFFFDK